jgi:hypothetical protein
MPPHNVTVVTVTAYSIKVTWEEPTNSGSSALTLYHIAIENVNTTMIVHNSTVSGGHAVANVTGLTPSTDYIVWVAAQNDFGISSTSNPVLFHTMESRHFKPQNLTITRKTSTSIAIKWIPPVISHGEILQYEVEYVGLECVNPIPETFYKMVTLSTAFSFVHIDGLLPYSLYNVSVRAYTVMRDGGVSTIAVRTDEDAPSPPTNLTLANVSTSSVLVEWSNPIYPNGVVDFFCIFLFDGESGTLLDGLATSNTPQDHFVLFSGLKPAYEYRIDVAAHTSSIGKSSSITICTQGSMLCIHVCLYMCALCVCV